MDMKEERADGREVRESYTMLMESEAIIRNHRTLRREICISRIVIFILLITCMAFCVTLYIQQVHGSKNNENMNKEKAYEMFTEFQTGSQEANEDVQTPPMASLSISKQPNLMNTNLTWMAYNNRMNDFSLDDAGESLIIPQDGNYRLSLQITYREVKQQPEEQQINLAQHIVLYSDSYGVPRTILSVYETVYKKNPWLKSMFSEVIYVFNKGDRVKVESKNGLLIDSVGEPWTKNFLAVQFVSKIKEL